MSGKAIGEELAHTGTTANRLRYEGQFGYYRDLVTRLYVRARELRPDNGRWMSRDPLLGRRGQGPLQYPYAMNSPAAAADPSGEIAVVPANRGQWRVGLADPVTHPWCCGDFQAYWNFKLSAKAKEQGWLVQHIVVNGQYTSCAPGSAPVPVQYDYWEAWPVPHLCDTPSFTGPPQCTPWQPADDTFAWASALPQFSSGWARITGEVKFFYISAMGLVNPSMWGKKSPGRGPAGILNCTTAQPAFWGNASRQKQGVGRHSTGSNWNCCGLLPPSSTSWAIPAAGQPVNPC